MRVQKSTTANRLDKTTTNRIEERNSNIIEVGDFNTDILTFDRIIRLKLNKILIFKKELKERGLVNI